MDSPRVLTVGAYERDNFGDLLFLLVTERYLRGAEIVAAAPFAADMTALLGRRVPAYGPLLQRERFDAIWTVGGQVGGIDLERAYRLSASPEAYRRFRRGSARRRAAILTRATGGVPLPSPYIPDARAHPRNADAVTVLNSAGLAGIGAAEPDRRARLVALLRDRSFVAVRDRPSSAFLSGLGIEHRLVPDAVHALGAVVPGERDPDADVAILQLSSAILGRLGPAEVAERIAASPGLTGLRIRLLAAGTATGHDSVADYARLAALVRGLAPAADIEVLRERRPLELVDHIRRARVAIGTSLHVRIVAAAYGVARVTLAKPKPTRYARTWDRDMPFDVGLDGLDAAIGAAVEAAERPEAAAYAAELTRLANEHLVALAGRVLGQASARAAASGRSAPGPGTAW